MHALDELVCDTDLELYIMKKRLEGDFICPTLRIVNGVSLDVTEPVERGKQKGYNQLMNRLNKVVGSYSIASNM